MSIMNTAELVTMAHAEGRTEAATEFLALAKRMDGYLDGLAEYGYINDTGRRLWTDLRDFIDKSA